MTFRLFELFGKIPPNISLKFMPISSIPTFEKISTIGILRSSTSRSIYRLSSFPSRSIFLSFSLVEDDPPASGCTTSNCVSVISSSFLVSWFPAFGRRISSILSSAIFAALSFTASLSLTFPVVTVSSRRSLIIDSTSRPTYPTSVNLEASTLLKGESVNFDRRLAISVFPTPVGPISIIFFGAISSRSSFGTCCLRQRFLKAIATERFALS